MRLILSLLAVVLAAGVCHADPVDNPEYKNWAGFKPGTTTTMKMDSDFNGTKSEVTITSKLVEVGADKLVIETVTASKIGGMEFKQPATKRDVPKTIEVGKPAAGDKPANPSKPEGTTEEGAETLKVGGVEVKTKWYKYKAKTAAGEAEGQTWTSDEVPGQVVKSVTKAGGVSTKMELTEFKKP